MRGESLGDELMRVVAPFVPGELVSPDALAALAATMRIFPAGISRIYGLECRLGTEQPETDLFMRIAADRGGRDLLLAPARDGIDARAARHPVWRKVRELARAWASPRSALRRDVPQIWLEFDVAPDRARGVPLPGILFLHPRFPDEPSHDEWVRRHLDIVERATRLMTARRIAPAIQRRVRQCVAALPAGARVFNIGVMVARDVPDVRLCLAGLARGTHAPYLARIGHRGAAEVAALLRAWEPLTDTINLDLDVGEELGSTAHLELRCDEETAPGAALRWRRLIDALIERGLARADKGAAFAAWPGLPVEQVHELHDRSLFLRKLSHVKLAWRPDRPLETKGYFGVWECASRRRTSGAADTRRRRATASPEAAPARSRPTRPG